MTREEREDVIQYLENLRLIQSDNFMKDGISKAIEALKQGFILDKIRAEIAELSHYYPMGHDYQIAITRCIAVIDKYKAEKEVEE